MATKMVDLGIKRKDLHPQGNSVVKSEKNYDNEVVHPEIDLSGTHAEMMGAEDLKEGDEVEQKVRWKVKRHSKTTEKGKTDYRMTLCILKASDCQEAEPEKPAKKTDADDGDGADDSPAMAYITGRSSKAE